MVEALKASLMRHLSHATRIL